MSTSRRRFLQSSALAAATVSVAPLAAADKPATPAPSDDPRMLYYDQFYFKEKPVFGFEYPFDGGVLQEGTGYPILGTETGADGVKRLRIHVVVRPGGVGNLQVFDPEGTVMLPNHITAYIREHQGWMDPNSGIIFYNGVMPTTCEWIPTTQTEWLHHRKLDNPKQNLLINIAGHEQYWWPFYRNYKSDNFERWDTALRHVTEHGYKSIWIDDGFFGGCG